MICSNVVDKGSFVHYIAAAQKRKLVCDTESVRFMSVISDGSTNSAAWSPKIFGTAIRGSSTLILRDNFLR